MKRVASLAIFAGFLFLYMLTLRPGVLPADSGEFQLAASQLQIAHPPGFPLYILIGWLFTYLPGTAASNLNFLSALFSSLTLSLMPWLLGELPNLETKSSHRFAAVGGMVAAILLGTSTTFWSQATTTNIRSLTTLFAVLGFYFLLKWVASWPSHDPSDSSNGQWGTDKEQLSIGQPANHATSLANWSLVTAVLITSLGVTHHLSLAFVALVMVVVVLATNWRILFDRKLIGWLVLAVAAGLFPWLLLPILEPSLRNWSDFFVYVTGLGFGNDFFFVESAADLLIRLRVMWNVLTFQFHWSVIVLALLALGWISWLRGRVGLLLGGSFLLLTLIAATYRAPQTVEYMLPAYLPLVISFGWLVANALVGVYGGGTILAPKREVASRPHRPLRWVVLILILFAGWQTVQRWPQTWDSYAWLAQQHDTADYAFEILDNAPENGVVYSSWHWFTPLSYLQQVEGHRPDLDIVFVDPTFNNDWSTAIIDELVANRPVVSTNFDPDTFPSAPFLPLGEAFLWPVDTEAAKNLASDFKSIDLFLGQRVEIQAVETPMQVAMSEKSAVTIAWQPAPIVSAQQLPISNLKLFVHLVGSDGQIYAQQDVAVTAQAHGLSLTRFELTPRPGIPLGEAQIMLGAYLADGTQLPDSSGEPRTVIGRVEVTGTRWRPVTHNPQNEVDPATGWRLIGTDVGSDFGWGDGQSRLYRHWELEHGHYWTSVEMIPASGEQIDYVPLGNGITWLGFSDSGSVEPGGQLNVTHRFQSDRPILRDIGIAVRQVGYEADNFTWAWLNSDPDNDIPATGAIPTLKWISGSQIDHPRTLTIPQNAVAGQATEGFLRLYDVFTRRPVPILDERVTADGRPWIRYTTKDGVVTAKQ